MADTAAPSGGAPSAPTGGASPAPSAAPSTAKPAVTPTASPVVASKPQGAPPATTKPAAPGAPAQPGGAQEPAPSAPWSHEVTVHGRKIRITDDDCPPELRAKMGEERAIAFVRRGMAGDLALREAAEVRKAADSALAGIKDPERMVAELAKLYGGDASKVDAAIERYYAKRLAEAEAQAKLDPKDREIQRLRAEADARSKRDAEAAAKAQEARAKAATQQLRAQYTESFSAAIKAAGLPATPHVLARMATHARQAVAAGHEPVPENLAADVREELRAEWEATHGSASPEELEAIFGAERMKALRKRDIEKFRAERAAAATPPPRTSAGTFAPASGVSKKPEPRPMTTREFFKTRRGT